MGACEAQGRANASSERDRDRQGGLRQRSMDNGRSRTHAVPAGCDKSTEGTPVYVCWSLPATTQEHLRFHATVHHIWRRSAEDDILPLFEPIKTQSGTLITQVPLPAGTNVVLAFACYNRYADRYHQRGAL